MKAIAMPRSGSLSPVFSWLNSAVMSPEPTDMPSITALTLPIVISSPQKVPSSPRNISSPVA